MENFDKTLILRNELTTIFFHALSTNPMGLLRKILYIIIKFNDSKAKIRR